MQRVGALLDGQIASEIYRLLNVDAKTDIVFIESEPCKQRIVREQPDILVSAGYQHVLDAETLDAVDRAINCHWSYLPYAQGANTNVWSIIDDHPAGVTIHEMVPKVDAGPIISQRTVPIHPDDNGKTLNNRLIDAQVELFADTWPQIRNGDYETSEQDVNAGTYHRRSEFNDLCELDLDAETTWREALDRLRALTHPPYDNAYFEIDGERYYVDIEIRPAEQ